MSRADAAEDATPCPGPAPTPAVSPLVAVPQAPFLYRLSVATMCLLVAVLGLYLLREFKSILQPLFVAVFVCYVILPPHRWLVARGVPSLLAYVVILLLIVSALYGLGALVYRNVDQFLARAPYYEQRVNSAVHELAQAFDLEPPAHPLSFSDLSLDQGQVLAALGTFRDFFAALAVTFVYLVFVIAEKLSLRRRVALALGDMQGARVLEVVEAIDRSITAYLSVKTSVSVAAAVFSMLTLAIFGVPFFVTLGILIGLLNYIPYVGSLVALVPALALSFLELPLWQALVVTLLLIAIQQICGLLEPRIAGQRLGVSPLLILLSLAFWGVVWGIVGMILAVPLLMTMKIILENIPETRPLATLMSNQCSPSSSPRRRQP